MVLHDDKDLTVDYETNCDDKNGREQVFKGAAYKLGSIDMVVSDLMPH